MAHRHFAVFLLLSTTSVLPDYGALVTDKPGIEPREAFNIVQKHNKIRAGVFPSAANMEKMEWDDGLSKEAWRRAVAECQHAVVHGQMKRMLGQNLMVAEPGALAFGDVLHAWFLEGEHYNSTSRTCAKNHTCDHYTQIIWASSQKIGCARYSCQRRENLEDLFLCVYFPGGNWRLNGHIIAPYKPGLWCSLCTSTKSGCLGYQGGGLCEIPQNHCRMNCGHNGQLNTKTCKCECVPAYSGKYCEVKCIRHCVHGRYREEACSCLCDSGFGGQTCAERTPFPTTSCAVLVDNTCFMVSSDSKTFYNAQNHCENQGGVLAQILSQKTQDLLSFYLSTLETQNEVLQSEVDKPNYWIGLTYKLSRSLFRWDGGKSTNFTAFALGQPNNHGFANCVEMHAASGYNWNDQQCRANNRYICQFVWNNGTFWPKKVGHFHPPSPFLFN
uniref:C-type lectin domain family 18 member A-like isoform X2 n=1 Tax=Myxine glutinosa TaxID=7769 RepID=UPI00358EAD8E